MDTVNTKSKAKSKSVYREKVCPYCGITHRRRGPYCCQSHASSSYRHTEETKAKLKAIHLERALTPEGLAHAEVVTARNIKRGKDNAKLAAGEYILQEEDYELNVPFNMNDDFEEDDVKINW